MTTIHANGKIQACFVVLNMYLLTGCVGFLIILQISAYQNDYIIYQENVTIPYFDSNFINVLAGVYSFNNTVNALNMTVTLKYDLPENGRMYLTAYRWLKTDYKARLVHIGKKFVDALHMEAFGLEVLCLDYIRPPLMWPVKKGVTYRTTGWSPDSTKFPPNLPGGSYKINLSFEQANKTVICVLDWFIKIIYKK